MSPEDGCPGRHRSRHNRIHFGDEVRYESELLTPSSTVPIYGKSFVLEVKP